MPLTEILYTLMFSGLSLLLVAGSYLTLRDRYWLQVWKSLGRPEIRNIEELKALSKKEFNVKEFVKHVV
jgi:hypothetical protein